MTKPIYLSATLPAYPGRDGTRHGAQRAAAAAIAASVAKHGKGEEQPEGKAEGIDLAQWQKQLQNYLY